MTATTVYSFILYAIVTSITPGPNNVMVTTSGVTYGFRRTLPAVIGVGVGFGIMLAIVGLGIGNLLTDSPVAFEALRLIGIAYLLYLAWKIGTDVPPIDAGSVEANASLTGSHAAVADPLAPGIQAASNPHQRPIGFWGAALFQWVNPKGWIIALGAISAYTSPGTPLMEWALLAGAFAVLSIPCVGLWAWMGERLQVLLSQPQRVRRFNLAMALLLVASVVPSIAASVQYHFGR